MKRHRGQRPPPGLVFAKIEKLSHDCRGIARIEGKTVFIQGALTGEEVAFQYTSVKRDFSEGKLVNVITASNQRVASQCADYDMCGGCSLQHLDNHHQITEKQAIFLDIFQRIAHLTPEKILAPLEADVWNYRNKARLSVRYVRRHNATMLGFRERDNPKFITNIDSCPVLNSQVDKDIIKLRELLDSLDDKYSIAQIEVAAGDDEIALIFRNLHALTAADEDKLRHFADSHKYRIYLQPGGEDSVYAFHPQTSDDYLSYRLANFDLQLKFHPCDFIQINPSLNRLMVDRAVELINIQPEDEILDLFCGLGNFSLPLATKCAKVIGIEGSQAMVDRALMNARANRLDNVEFHMANLDDPEQVQHVLKQKFNKILIDPPRSGAFEIVKAIGKISPERVVYVSCNPVTLARDADILVHQQGYRLEAAGIMDMFPNTAHLESIALFVKG